MSHDRSGRTYLGDGVYAEWDDHDNTIWLITSDGMRDTNTIALEPEVFSVLLRFVEKGRPTQ